MTAPITILYRLTALDLMQSARARLGPDLHLAFDAALAAAFIAFSRYQRDWLGATEANIAFAIGLALLVAMPLALVIVPIWLARSQPKYQLDYETTFSDDGVATRSAAGASDVKWSFFRRAVIDRRVCVLFYGRWQFATVPLRCFADDEARRAFVALVRANVASVKIRNGAPGDKA